MRGLGFLSLVALAAGCADDGYMVVTVRARPAVHDATKLRVVLSNAGSMRTDDRDLGGATFPLTFAISAPGRTGDLGIAVDALDGQGFVVGHGESTASLASSDADVMLDSADFVVNTEFANDQFVSDDFEAVGLQLGATSDGKFTVGYRDYPCTNCDIYARRFDATGRPLTSDIAAGPASFKVTTTLTTSAAQAAVASADTKTVVLWDFTNAMGGGTGVACRGLDTNGAAMASQISIGNDASSDVVSATGLVNTNFAVAWSAPLGTGGLPVVRTTVVRPDCTPLFTPVTVSTALGSFGARRAHVAANNGFVLYSWIVDDQDVHARVGNLTGGFPGSADTLIVPHTAAQQIDHVRVAPLGSAFALVARWSTSTGMGPGKIEIYPVSTAGQATAPAVLVTDKSGSDFASDKAFGVASGNGTLLVAWHQCDNGLGSCDVWGRYFSSNATPLGDAFMIPTTTAGDQMNPSVAALPGGAFVAAWNDGSLAEPDHSGMAVRARILYPPGAGSQ